MPPSAPPLPIAVLMQLLRADAGIKASFDAAKWAAFEQIHVQYTAGQIDRKAFIDGLCNMVSKPKVVEMVKMAQQGAAGGKMADAELDLIPPNIKETFEALRQIHQRVAQEARFTTTCSDLESQVASELRRLQDELHQQRQKCSLLEELAFKPDVKVLSYDGVAVPALMRVLTGSSIVLQRMFEHNTAETRDCEVKTDATAPILMHVVKEMHHPSPSHDEVDDDTLLAACELASRWELSTVLRSFATALGRKMGAQAAASVLAAADRHLEVDTGSAIWRELREEAAEALARSMPSGANYPAFKTLSLDAILEVMSHAKEVNLPMPILNIDLQSPGLTAVGGSKGKFVHDWTRCGTQSEDSIAKFRLTAQKTDSTLNVRVQYRGALRPQVKMQVCVHNLTALTHADVGSQWDDDKSYRFKFPIDRLDTAVANAGKVTVQGSVIVTARQRKADMLNLWLLATGRVPEAPGHASGPSPLGPAELLLCLRACACGFDVERADVDALKEQLTERFLATTGTKKELQTRLRDAMHAELHMVSPGRELTALGSACRALAELTASYYRTCAEDRSLFELDAAAFSMVLTQDTIVVESESAILEHAVRWASRVGRTEEMVSRVMPLVRFPLVSLLQPSAPLKLLKQRNEVVAQLIKEALSLQIQPASAVATFTPTKHRLLPGVLPGDTDVVPRAKRRKLCKHDKVMTVDPAEALFSSAF